MWKYAKVALHCPEGIEISFYQWLELIHLCIFVLGGQNFECV